MTYGIQIWGTSKNSNLNKFQAFQSINLQLLTNSPWYVSNRTVLKDLKIQYEVVVFPRIMFETNPYTLTALKNYAKTNL